MVIEQSVTRLRGFTTDALPGPARPRLLFNVPQKRNWRVEHAGKVFRERASADELARRDMGHKFERALSDLSGKVAPPRLFGCREPCRAQRLDLLIRRPAGRRAC